jgi:hypothetical protein
MPSVWQVRPTRRETVSVRGRAVQVIETWRFNAEGLRKILRCLRKQIAEITESFRQFN